MKKEVSATLTQLTTNLAGHRKVMIQCVHRKNVVNALFTKTMGNAEALKILFELD